MKDENIEFYLNKFSYIENEKDIDISFIKPLQRRRLSLVDKFSLDILNKIVTEDIENIIFASQYGEFERLKKMIEQYQTENEVSPSYFSCSVHNFPPAFYLLTKKLSIPYTSIGAGNNTLSIGILTSAISKFKKNLFCYSDVNDKKSVGFGINLSKTKTPSSKKYRITLNQYSEQKNNTSRFNEIEEFNEFVKLFSGEQNSIKTNLYNIERVLDEK